MYLIHHMYDVELIERMRVFEYYSGTKYFYRGDAMLKCVSG